MNLVLCIIGSLPRMRAAAVNLVPNLLPNVLQTQTLPHQPRPLRHQFSPSNASCSQGRRRNTTCLCLSLYARNAHATSRYILTYAGAFGCQQPTHVSIRQHMSAYVSICQHTSSYVIIRHHTSSYVSEQGAVGCQQPTHTIYIYQHTHTHYIDR